MGGVKKFFWHFDSVQNEYFGISPRAEHCLGVLDVLGKCGYLVEAEEYMRSYGQLHGDIDLEDYAEELMVDIDR